MGSYELSEELHTPPARHHLAHPVDVGALQRELISIGWLPNPYKARVTRSKTGREPRNWKVVSDFWKLELVYGSWQAAMDAARVLADTGRVPAFYLLGAQPVGTPF